MKSKQSRKQAAWKVALVGLVGSSMLAMAGAAVAGRPVAGSATEGNPCGVFSTEQEYFVAACQTNIDLALRLMSSDAAYTGSCEGGGACADSVYNKLQSAASKFSAPKVADGCAKLADIQTDLMTWNAAEKQKINNNGFYEMSKAIRAIQSPNCP